jgi:hypothetical protein
MTGRDELSPVERQALESAREAYRSMARGRLAAVKQFTAALEGDDRVNVWWSLLSWAVVDVDEYKALITQYDEISSDLWPVDVPDSYADVIASLDLAADALRELRDAAKAN